MVIVAIAAIPDRYVETNSGMITIFKIAGLSKGVKYQIATPAVSHSVVEPGLVLYTDNRLIVTLSSNGSPGVASPPFFGATYDRCLAARRLFSCLFKWCQ